MAQNTQRAPETLPPPPRFPGSALFPFGCFHCRGIACLSLSFLHFLCSRSVAVLPPPESFVIPFLSKHTTTRARLKHFHHPHDFKVLLFFPLAVFAAGESLAFHCLFFISCVRALSLSCRRRNLLLFLFFLSLFLSSFGLSPPIVLFPLSFIYFSIGIFPPPPPQSATFFAFPLFFVCLCALASLVSPFSFD